MDFYTLTYLQEQNNVAQFVQYGIVVIIFLVLIVATILYIKDKFRTKYRDLSIIMALILLFMAGINFTEYQNGKIRVEECLKHGISANDLMFKLRNKGIYEVAKVKSGILEQNGQLTVIEFSDKDHVRYPLISDGQLNVDVLELINQDEE